MANVEFSLTVPAGRSGAGLFWTWFRPALGPVAYPHLNPKANTPEFAHAQRQRKKVEALFAELKNHIGLRRLRLRRLKFVREQFFLGRDCAEPQASSAVP